LADQEPVARGAAGQVYNIGDLDIEENLTMARRLLRLMVKPETLRFCSKRACAERSIGTKQMVNG
jgi:hypothetical protein